MGRQFAMLPMPWWGRVSVFPPFIILPDATKTSKREDDLIKMPDARRQFLSPKNVKIPAFSLPEKIFSLVKQFQRVVRQMYILILLSRCHHGRKCSSRECILCGWEHHEKEG